MTAATVNAAATAERFWRATFEEKVALIRAAGAARTAPPPMVKRYPGARRYPLPARPPLALGDALPAFTATVPAAGGCDVATLGTLLRYSYGYSRQQLAGERGWAYHRVVASARCLFPTELYVCWPGGGDLPTGVYHYDAAHHTLVAVRPGGYRDRLAAASAERLDDAACVLLLTCRFARTAHRYGPYAYRLGTQEAGMVAGNAQLVAARLGLRARLHHQFADAVLDDLLGLDPDREGTLCAIPVRGTLRVDPGGADGAPVGSPHDEPAERLDPVRDALLLAQHRASRYRDAAGLPAAADPMAGPAPAPGGRPIPPPAPPAGLPDLADLLRRRGSGSFWFSPAAGPVPAEALWRITRYAPGPVDDDAGPLGLDCYVIVTDVAGVAAGRYRVRPRDGALQPVGEGTPVVMDRPTAALFGLVPSVARRTNLMVFLVGDRARATARYGARGYRVLNQRAGALAQRVSLLAAADGLAARVINQYDEGGIRALFGLPGADPVPVFEILVARDPMPTSYDLPAGW